MTGNVSITQTPAGVARRKTLAYDEYITWRALGGMMVSETGAISQMTLAQFCERYNVNERTTWRWSAEPGLEEKIKQRLDEIVPRSRVVSAWNRLFLLGMTSLGSHAQHHDQRAAVDALKTYLGHYGELRLPTVKQEVEIKHSVSDLLKAAQEDGVIEGEIVDAAANHAAADGEDPGPLPLPS